MIRRLLLVLAIAAGIVFVPYCVGLLVNVDPFCLMKPRREYMVHYIYGGLIMLLTAVAIGIVSCLVDLFRWIRTGR